MLPTRHVAEAPYLFLSFHRTPVWGPGGTLWNRRGAYVLATACRNSRFSPAVARARERSRMLTRRTTDEQADRNAPSHERAPCACGESLYFVCDAIGYTIPRCPMCDDGQRRRTAYGTFQTRAAAIVTPPDVFNPGGREKRREGGGSAKQYWSPAEDRIMRRHYGRMPVGDVVAMLPGRSAHGVYDRARKLGLASAHAKGAA